MVDLLKDEDTGRAPGENIPPSFHVTAHEVLNSPAPPSAGQSAIDPLRYSVDVVSLRAKKEKGLAKCHLPTGLELIGEHIRECGLRPVDDDKRPLYEAVVGLFGSLYEAAQSCREPFRTMLLAMKDRELLESQIREKARLGKTKRTPAEAPFIRNWYKKDPIRARLGEERFREHASICHPPADSPLNALDYWRDKGVVGQVFLTPKCPACRRQTWVGSIDLSAPVICRDCGRPIPIGGSVEVGYRLEPIVGAALDDGLVPVALTGEFLRNLTHQGFQWVPGFRFAKAGKEQDIDIVALCDGHLVMAECKELGSTKPSVKTWSKVGKQFEGLIETARDCSAEAVFLASLAWSYPPGIRELVKSANDEKMSVHLLTRADLDKGHRKGMRRIGGERKEVWLHIHDFLPAQPRPRRKRRGKREVRL
jgi:ribosomal protein S27E